jgi:ribonuclease HI
MSSIVDEYIPEGDIQDFWNILEKKWAAGAPRARDECGRPVFQDRTRVVQFFQAECILCQRHLCDLRENKVSAFQWFFKLEQAAMIDIIRGLRAAKERQRHPRAIVVTPYQPKMDIRAFWNSLEAQWKTGAKRRVNFDGGPVFENTRDLFEFFDRRKVLVVEDLFHMRDCTVTEYATFDVYEKAALIDIIQVVSKAAIQAGAQQKVTRDNAAPTAPTNSAELMSLRKELETARAELRDSKKRCMQVEADSKKRCMQLEAAHQAKNAKISDQWKEIYKQVAMDWHPDKTSKLDEREREKREKLFQRAVNMNDSLSGKNC